MSDDWIKVHYAMSVAMDYGDQWKNDRLDPLYDSRSRLYDMKPKTNETKQKSIWVHLLKTEFTPLEPSYIIYTEYINSMDYINYTDYIH